MKRPGGRLLDTADSSTSPEAALPVLCAGGARSRTASSKIESSAGSTLEANRRRPSSRASLMSLPSAISCASGGFGNLLPLGGFPMSEASRLARAQTPGYRLAMGGALLSCAPGRTTSSIAAGP